MKIGFFAFTGTGNTLRVCKTISSELTANGVESDIHLIQNVADINLVSDYDRIVIAHPVHGFNTPMPMLDFINSMPNTTAKTSVYIIRVSGEPLKLNDAAGIVPKRILNKKGYNVKGEFRYIMPYNIIFKHSDNMATRMENASKIKAKNDSLTIINDKVQLTNTNAFSRFVSFICKIEHSAMPVFGKHYKVTEACICCGLCEKLCPSNNINIKDGKPIFGKECVGCMACSFSCPHDAIRISFLDGWRVNGSYDFNSTPATDDEICNYCKKSYLRYFHEVEKETVEDTSNQ